MIFGDELFSYDDGVYRTTPHHLSWAARACPTCSFYRQFTWNIYQSSVLAKQGKYDGLEWSRASYQVLQSLESVGVQVEFSGVEHIRQLNSPCVFVANHMSMFETTVLPAIIQPIRDVTFVVKQSLLDYPFFGRVVRARDPIAVSRDNPRADLKAVLHGGLERLQRGVSIIVFPQTTRSLAFDPDQFNTIGVKLALRAKVPVIPIALVTDAWGNGKWFKDLGRIDPNRTVHLAFGPPMMVQDRGSQQHQQIIDFITNKLHGWNDSAANETGP